MDSVLNCAFIGCGNISQTKHLPLCREDPHLHIRALYDPVREKAAMCSKQFGTSDTYIAEEPGDIFQDDAVDVVFVATPNNTHAAYAIQALNAGKHVICEKPMAISPTEAEAMLEASRKNRRLLHISYQNRYTHQARYAKRLTSEGALSHIYYAKAYALRRRAVPTWGITTQRKFQGGGPLIDIGSHAIDLALWLCNNFEPDYAVGTTYRELIQRGSDANRWGQWNQETTDIEDAAFGFVVMKNGMTLLVESSYALNLCEEMEASVDLFGVNAGLQLRQNGTITLIHEMAGSMLLSTNEIQQTPRSLTPGVCASSPSEEEHREFVNMLMDGSVWDPAAEQACVVSRIVDGLYRSAASKRPVWF